MSQDPYLDWLGISPDDRPIDHYRLLGLPRFEANRTKIDAAADGLMAEIRKYQHGPRSAQSQQILNEIAAARHCLLDAPAKSAYDMMLEGISLLTDKRPSDSPDPVRVPSRLAAAGAATKADATVIPIPPLSDVVLFPRGDRKARAARSRPGSGVPWLRAGWGVLTVAVAVWGGGQMLMSRSRVAVESPPKSSALVAEVPEADARPELVPQVKGEFRLGVEQATCEGAPTELDFAGPFPTLTGLTNGSVVRWRIRVEELPPNGVFVARVTYQTEGEGSVAVRCGTREQEFSLDSRAGVTTDEVFLVMNRTGEQTVSLHMKLGGSQPLTLHSVRLTRRSLAIEER